MNKLDNIISYVNGIIASISDVDTRNKAYSHANGVAQLSSLLAQKSGLNGHLAYIIGLLHDIYYYKTGCTVLHGVNGCEMVRVAFKYELHGIFSPEQENVIIGAIFHHSDKEHIHGPYCEILKNADVLQRFLCHESLNFSIYSHNRLISTCHTLDIPLPHGIETQPAPTPDKVENRLSHLGDIGESLACKKIIGDKNDELFMEIIRYFPENSAVDNLIGAWCSAFVYHCCMAVGIHLPLRVRMSAVGISNYRLACVMAWYEWAVEMGFCHFESDGYTPQRGDIVIYNKIISPDKKPKNSTWCDHMGIVLSCNEQFAIVAEGNGDNLNISGIYERRRDLTIGCYIHIPNDFTYQGDKIDFQTGDFCSPPVFQ